MKRIGQYTIVAALVGLAAVVACNKIRNFDTFWHLKSGQWMLSELSVLDHDPFTATDTPEKKPGKWVNVHWGFQVIVAAVHRIGGFGGLVVLKMIVFAGTIAVFAFWLRKRSPPALLIFVAIAVMIGVEERVRVRPELFTFLFFITTLVIVESVRRDGSLKRLWWLVPINILWVNMHGLFIVGVAATWAIVIGAFIDRMWKRGQEPFCSRTDKMEQGDRLNNKKAPDPFSTGKALLPIIVATAACFVSPWPTEAALHPLLLRTRVTGEQAMYTFGVSEFCPTYRTDIFTSVSMITALILALAALEAMRARRKSLPTGHLLWYLGFLALGIMAVRNVALFCIPAGFLLAIHGGDWLHEHAKRHRVWAKVGKFASVIIMSGLLAATAAGYATEAVYRWQQRQACRFGLGLVAGLHHVEMAKWLGRSELPGDILTLDFGDGGTFIYYSYPRRRVWMDGRLEIHTPEKFKRLQRIGRNLLSPIWASDPHQTPLPPTVRFVVVRSDATRHLEALNNSARFKLVYIGQAGVCFARIPLPGEKNISGLRKWHDEQKLKPANVEQFDRPMMTESTDVLLPGTETTRRWYRRNVPPAHWNMGTIFFHLEMDNLTVRYLSQAEKLRLAEPVSRLGLLAESHRRVNKLHPIEPERDLPIDPNLARSLALLGRIDLTNLQSKRTRKYAMVRVRVMWQARQMDAADQAMSEYLENLPILKRWHPKRSDLDFRDSIHLARRAAEAAVRRFPPDLTPKPGMKALLLLRRDIGLIDRAVAELESAGDILPHRGKLLLGDLYLRKGLSEKAKKVYESVEHQENWEVLMRLGLCGWVAGDFSQAENMLQAATQAAPAQPEPVIYLSLLYEQSGRYKDATELLDEYTLPLNASPDDQTTRLIKRIEARLKMKEKSN